MIHDEQNELLTRRVEKILPSRRALERLMKERKIRLYLGIDPTGGRLHLGHTIGLRILNSFALAGHEAIVLFGTGTVLVGDPSQREKARKEISEKEIAANVKNWKKQVSSVLDLSRVKIKYNGDWLLKLTLRDLVHIASKISAVQLFKRDMFQRRIARGDTIWYHETMYPLLQGYDSVVLDVDLEIGGTDQEFNMLIGRELLKKMKNKEKYVLTTPMILGIDGKQMSKTSGNCVWVDDSPNDMFGKLMRIPDSQIVPYLQLVTNVPLARVNEIEKHLSTGQMHSMDAKKELAAAVVEEFYSQEEASKQKAQFEDVFQKGKKPVNIPELTVGQQSVNLVKVLAEAGITKSKSEAKKLLSQGAIEIDGKKLKSPEILINKSRVVKVGKYRFVKLIKKSAGKAK